MNLGRIAVAGLNPHAGEGGLLGHEEQRIIAPAIKQAKAIGPCSADTVFYRAVHGEFDAVVAMYHDQGLAPFKLIAFDTGVNVTLGLPFVRTSPDHGTALDIAGKNIARPDGMIAAINLAAKLAKRRRKSLSASLEPVLKVRISSEIVGQPHRLPPLGRWQARRLPYKTDF